MAVFSRVAPNIIYISTRCRDRGFNLSLILFFINIPPIPELYRGAPRYTSAWIIYSHRYKIELSSLRFFAHEHPQNAPLLLFAFF